MSTKALLGCKCKDGKIRACLTNHDGYPDAVVPELYRVASEDDFIEIWNEIIENCECGSFPFEYVVHEELIGRTGDPRVFDTEEDFIKSQDFVCEYYLFKDGIWYNGLGIHYNSGHVYDIYTGYRTRKQREEKYTSGFWIPLKEMMVEEVRVIHGFNEKKYYEYLDKNYPEYLRDNYMLETEEEVKEFIEDKEEFIEHRGW